MEEAGVPEAAGDATPPTACAPDERLRGVVDAGGVVEEAAEARGVGEAEALERTVDRLRERFGAYSLQRCTMLQDRKLTGLNPKDDHVIHPVSYFR